MRMKSCANCQTRYAVNLAACPKCFPDQRPQIKQDTRAYDAALALGRRPGADVERDARATAVRFGVDPNLSPRERCMAVARKVRLFGQPAQELMPREPGQDDEEDAYA